MKCDGDITIPAFSESIINGISDGGINTKYGLVLPLDVSYQCLMVGYTLVDPHRKDMDIPIRVLNPSSTDIVIQAGEKVAYLVEVDEVKCESDTVDSVSEHDAAQEYVPEHLTELFECSSNQLNGTEKEQLKSLLIKHSDVVRKVV